MATVNEKKLKDQLTGYSGPTQATASQIQAQKTGTATQQTQTGNLQNLMSNFTTAAKQALQNQQQTKASQPSQYTGLQGVNGNTAQQLGNLQQGYQQGDAVTAAQQQLQQVMDRKPQGYESKYGQQLDQILNQITNPEKFKYSFNGDELFKSYADQYTQLGKQAAQNAMGQAAALTGGYGNSYAQQAANQQYQQYLLGLYDKGMDMYDRAYQRYQAGQNGLMDQFNVLNQADQTAYGRYRDDVGDWESERNYYTGRADTEAERDYGRYTNERDYYTGLAQVENADYRSEQERQEAIRQYEQNFAEEQRQFDAQLAENKRQWDQQFNYQKMSDQQKYAYNYVTSIIGNGQMPSAALLKQAGISEEDAQKMLKQVAAASGGGGGGRNKVTKTQIKNTANTLGTNAGNAAILGASLLMPTQTQLTVQQSSSKTEKDRKNTRQA